MKLLMILKTSLTLIFCVFCEMLVWLLLVLFVFAGERRPFRSPALKSKANHGGINH